MVGEVLGRYRIEAQVGAGAMGVVYRAHDPLLDRTVAIKVLQEAPGEASRARLLAEARAASALNHPHICTIFEVAEADGCAFIVMEYVDGRPLSQMLMGGRLPLGAAVAYALQIADALGHAHQRGFVHRDLKSGNIAVSTEDRVKILDFGLAHRLNAHPEDATGSLGAPPRGGAVAGTVAYMAPELLRGAPADTRSDVWAFGVVLYEMVMGARPFSGKTPFDLAAGVLADTDVQVPLNVPVALAAVIQRCLARHPARRYQQGGEIRAALEAYQSGAAAGSHGAVAVGGVRSFRFAAAALVVLTAVATAAAIGANVGGIRDRFGLLAGESALAFAERDWLLITDFDNQTGDPSFDRALNTAMQAAMGQSRYVNIVPNVRIRESLRRMERADAVRIDEVLGREIAQREGIDMVLHPTIASAGEVYILTASLIDPSSGVTLRSRTARARSRDAVLEALDALSGGIRGSLGEASAHIAQRSKPLNQVTTSSLEALRLFTLARDAHIGQQLDRARELYEKALAVDSSFTAARASLGIINVEFYDRAQGLELLDQAMKGVDRVTDVERMNVLAWHAQMVERNLPRAAEHFRSYLALHPDAAAAHNNLGRVYMFMGQLDLATTELQEALRLEPDLMLSYYTLADIYIHRRASFDEAIAVSRRQLGRNDRSARAYGQLAVAYVGKGELQQAELSVRRALEIDPRFVLDWSRLGYILRLQRRHDEALAAFERAIATAPDDVAAYYQAAVAAETVGKPAVATKHLDAGRAATDRALKSDPRDAFLLLQRAALTARAGGVERARQLLRDAEGSGDQPVDFAAVLALLDREADAISVLRRAVDNGLRDVVRVLVNPDLAKLNGNPEFDALVVRMRNRAQ